MTEQIELLQLFKGGLILGCLGLFFIWERLMSFTGMTRMPGNRTDFIRLGRNTGLWLINSAVSPIIVLPLSVWAATYSLPWRQGWWSPGVTTVLVDLILLDIWIYWWHRANHEMPFLWRFHQVHHLDQQMDVTTALRFHFGEVILSALVRAFIVWLSGVQLASIIIFEALLMASAIFHHSDARLPNRLEGLLSRLIITPSIHWVHHHALRVDTDSNYGAILSCWDRLFNSSNAAERKPDWKVGVENGSDKSLMALIAAPFKGR